MTERIKIEIDVGRTDGFGPWSPDKNIYHCVGVGKWKSDKTNRIWNDDHLSLEECHGALCRIYKPLIGTAWRAINVEKESRCSDVVVFERFEE